MFHSIILILSSIIFTNILLQCAFYVFKFRFSELSDADVDPIRAGRRSMGFGTDSVKTETRQIQYSGKRSTTSFVSKSLTSRSLDNSVNFSIFSRGDIVQNFKLIKKLETLGLNKIYHSDVSWSTNNLFLASNSTTADRQEKETTANADNSLIKSSDFINPKRSRCLQNQTFCLEENIFHGGHGEIWRAHKVNRLGIVNYDLTYILKRMHVKNRDDILYCAKREIYFGKLLADRSSFARFITYFVTEDDYWLVFHDEGISLQALIYAVTYNDDNAMLRPSTIWKKLRTTKSGDTSMKGIMYQLIAGVAELHREGIVHRDIKPSNVLLNTEVVPKLLVADFSSGLQNTPIFEAQLLYGSRGPTTDEESLIYAPPEVLLAIDDEGDGPNGPSIPFHPMRPESYDIWSVGVLFLEVVLGTADIFTVDHRTTAIIANKMRSKKQKKFLPKALLLASLAEFCIYRRPSDDDAEDPVVLPVTDYHQVSNNDNSMLSIGDNMQGSIQSEVQFTYNHLEILNSGLLGSLLKLRTCGLEELSKAILKRDPLALGLRDKWAVDLLSKLLQFDPMKRMSMTEALNHAFFQGAYVCEKDGSEYATKDELLQRCEEDFIINVHNGDDGDDRGNTTVAVVSNVSDIVSPLHLHIDHNITEEETILSGNVIHQASDDLHNNVIFQQQDPLASVAFRCPGCGRIFLGDWQACQHHLKLRKHGSRCMYPTHALPPCLSEHSLLPMDPHSGWCDLQGRRKYIEDVHAMYFSDHFKFFGVFDGHFGSQAAKFAATHIFGLFEHLVDLSLRETSSADDVAVQQSFTQTQQHLLDQANDKADWRHNLRTAEHFEVPLKTMYPSNLLGEFAPLSDDSEWLTSTDNSNSKYTAAGLYGEIFENGREEVTLTASQLSHIIAEAFRLTNRQLFRKANQSLAGPSNITSGIGGTTATIVVEFQKYLLIAHVGDSRVVACCSRRKKGDEDVQLGVWPIQLTLDHTPHCASEDAGVRERGGWIDIKGSVPRVNGYLAVTRSLGDSFLGDVVSSVPDVLVLDILPPHEEESFVSVGSDSSRCGILYSILKTSSLLFLIIASDGLWDVLSNDEATELVCESLVALVHHSGSSVASGSPEVVTFPADAFHEASKILAHEAFLRGSSDNIGVCVIDLSRH